MRKICAVITSRAQYGRMKYILRELVQDPQVELHVVVGGAALSDMYGNILQELEKDGIPVVYKVLMIIEGGSPLAMAKTTAIGLMEFSTILDNIKPDILLVRGDRFETIAAAVAAAYMNITLVHLEGGDVSGTIDDSVRHATTKFAHIHLTTTEDARARVIKLGEPADRVFTVGSPDVEFIVHNKKHISTVPKHIFDGTYSIGGIGGPIDVTKPYIVMMQHPVTTEYGKGRAHMEEILQALKELNMQTVVFWPNADAGTDEMSRAMRIFVNNEKLDNIHFFKHLPPQDFLALVNHAACLIGNSSAGIKECSFLGTPVVNIGTRQQGRLRGKNIVDVDYSKEEIVEAVRKQIKHGKYPEDHTYGSGDTSKKIAAILKTVPLIKEKRITY